MSTVLDRAGVPHSARDHSSWHLERAAAVKERNDLMPLYVFMGAAGCTVLCALLFFIGIFGESDPVFLTGYFGAMIAGSVTVLAVCYIFRHLLILLVILAAIFSAVVTLSCSLFGVCL